jgi:hypothetical protein
MDPAFIVPIFRSYLLRNVSKTVDDTYTTLGKALLHRPLRESLYGSYEMQLVRKVVTQKVLDIVSRKVSDLCFRKKLSTVLRKTGKDDLMKFSLEQLCGSVLLKQRNCEMSATYRLIYVLGILFK